MTGTIKTSIVPTSHIVYLVDVFLDANRHVPVMLSPFINTSCCNYVTICMCLFSVCFISTSHTERCIQRTAANHKGILPTFFRHNNKLCLSQNYLQFDIFIKILKLPHSVGQNCQMSIGWLILRHFWNSQYCKCTQCYLEN